MMSAKNCGGAQRDDEGALQIRRVRLRMRRSNRRLKPLGKHDDLCMEGDMAAELNELQTLLVEIGAFAAVVEDREIFKISSLDPLIARARSLGVVVPAPGTLDDLRNAVEKACGHAQGGATGSGAGSAPITARDILGNESGIPGDGP